MTEHEIHDLDCIVLLADLPEHGLRTDDVGTVVFVHNKGEAFEVEFVVQSGHTVALLTLRRDQVRRFGRDEEMVARVLAA